MKFFFKIIAVNLAVFVFLWIAVEVLLRFLGVSTLAEMEKKSQKQRFQVLCSRALNEKLVVYNAFNTDDEAMFKANPNFDFNILFKGRGPYRINRDGFRGNAFERVELPQPKVLVVGDSFVWGETATPIRNSFADLLQDAGYYLYNGGIPGTDPVQYLKVIKKYAPLLKPDVVAVFIYMGNDVRSIPHPTKPNHNLHYVSNFGYFLGYDNRNGRYFKNAEEAFDFLKKRYCGCTDHPGDFFMNNTLLGKLAYHFLYGNRQLKPDPKRKWLKDALAEMKETCRANGSELMIFLIPTLKSIENPKYAIENDFHLFEGFQYYYPSGFRKTDYQEPPDDHFSNEGHRNFAHFIIKTLKENGWRPK